MLSVDGVLLAGNEISIEDILLFVLISIFLPSLLYVLFAKNSYVVPSVFIGIFKLGIFFILKVLFEEDKNILFTN